MLCSKSLIETAADDDTEMKVVVAMRERRSGRDVDIDKRERTERARARLGLGAAKRSSVRANVGFARFDLSSLRRGIMAGAPCPIEVMKEVASTMHMSEITIAYGMTETSPVSFQSSRDDPLELRVSTVGRIQPHLEVKIVDRDGRIMPRGEAGELCTRGYSVMLGYWNDEIRTREAIDSAGWMHTGDLATIDDDGYCRIVGRIDRDRKSVV